jgi:outer membrane receptor for ferrienterochelin and colicins
MCQIAPNRSNIRSRTRVFAYWVAALICLLPALAVAEDIASVAGDEGALFRDIPTVYGASKYEQRVDQAPSSVTLVTSADIQNYGYRTLADILRAVRGFYVTYDRNYSYLGVRGFGRPGDYNSRVLLLVDGHRINDDVYSQGLLGTEFPLDVDLIDRVEVIRGAGSSIYGTDAFFGVVNVITKKARDFKGGEASVEGGSLRTAKGRATIGERFDNGLELMLSATAYHSSGQRSLYFPEFDTPLTHSGIAENRDGENADYLLANVALGNFNLRVLDGSRRKNVPTASFGTVFNDSRENTVDTRQYVDLKYQRQLDVDSELTARLYQDSYRYHGDYPIDQAPVVVNYDALDGRWWGAEFQYTTRIGADHHITLGTEFVNNYRQDQQNFNIDPYASLLESRQNTVTWGVYIQDEYAISRQLTLDVGLRYDNLDTVGGTINPRLALVYVPIPATTLKALYGTAFRAPNAYELYYYSPAVGFEQNSGLVPERVRTTELVLERTLTENVHAVVDIYRNEIDTLISLHTDPANGMLTFDNLDQARSRGLELELDGRWSNGLESRASYTVQQTTDGLTGAVLSNSPARMGKLNISIPTFRNHLFTGLELQYVSSRQTVQNTMLGGFVLGNLTLFERGLPGGIEASVSIYNLLNKNYADTGSAEHHEVSIGQNGRTFRVKLTLPI